MEIKGIKIWTCQKCGSSWAGRKSTIKPKYCSACHSPNWEKAAEKKEAYA